MATFKNCRFLPRIFSAVLSSVKRSHDQVVNYNFSSFTNQASGVAIKSFANGTHTRFLAINAADTSEENKDEEEKEETSETLETARPVVDVATSIDYLKSEGWNKFFFHKMIMKKIETYKTIIMIFSQLTKKHTVVRWFGNLTDVTTRVIYLLKKLEEAVTCVLLFYNFLLNFRSRFS